MIDKDQCSSADRIQGPRYSTRANQAKRINSIMIAEICRIRRTSKVLCKFIRRLMRFS